MTSARQGDAPRRTLFRLEVGACEVAQFHQPRLDFCGRQQEVERDSFGVVGLLCADLLLPDPVLDCRQEVVADCHMELGKGRHLDARGRFDAEHGGMAVGADESARAELDAAEVARDDDDNVRQCVLLDGLEDGVARRAARLAVVV